ncbi:MAG: ribonuclease HII [Desulfobulbaceae bacterium]|nr:ribonuclease HII [Desulfobulbaceae bacterium]
MTRKHNRAAQSTLLNSGIRRTAQDVAPDVFAIERGLLAQGVSPVAGVDEAGRGPLAGPVVAACVILPEHCEHHIFRDSKKLTEKSRKSLADVLHENGATFGLGLAQPEEIDTVNILQASLLAMKRAVEACAQKNNGILPACLLVDGTFPIPLATTQQTLIRGESQSASIAAASILAKVHRDQLMQTLHEQYPCYNWQQNKGYPTRAHKQAIAQYGPCPQHRKSFKGVREHVDFSGYAKESHVG